MEKSKQTVLDYLSDNPLSTAREIGRGCHQRHTIIVKALNTSLKEGKIGALRFPKLKELEKTVFYDTKSYYVKPNEDDIGAAFLKIMSSEKIWINRFKKIKYRKRNVWTFDILLKNAISTFHQEFKIFKLEMQRANRSKDHPSEKNLMNAFHRQFTENCKQEEPPEPYVKAEPMDYYQLMFDERHFFTKPRLRFLQSNKASSSKILGMMQKKHEWGDYRHAKLGKTNKAAKNLLARITDDNLNFNLEKLVRYQEQEKIWFDPNSDQNTLQAILYSGATKKDVLDYIYSHGVDYYLLSDKHNKVIENWVSHMVKRVKKEIDAKQKANLKT